MAERLSRYDAWVASRQKTTTALPRHPLERKRENLYSSRWQISQSPVATYKSPKPTLVTLPSTSKQPPAAVSSSGGSTQSGRLRLPWSKAQVDKENLKPPPAAVTAPEAASSDKTKDPKREKEDKKKKKKKDKTDKKKTTEAKTTSSSSALTTDPTGPTGCGRRKVDMQTLPLVSPAVSASLGVASNALSFPIVQYPFMCTNCGDHFKSEEGYTTHFGTHNLACAYMENEPVTNLDKFTIQNVMKSVLERRLAGNDPDDEFAGHELLHITHHN